jgi:methylthioribose-1-phosphate isomerase
MKEAERTATVENIRYDRSEKALYILDQTLLPWEEREIRLRTAEEMFEAIRLLRVRGAPAIGICAGYCMLVLAESIPEDDPAAFLQTLKAYGAYLDSARPTAVNLSWAVRSMLWTAEENLEQPRDRLLTLLLEKAAKIHRDDIEKCMRISELGLTLIRDGDGILTHCNAGPLATSRYGRRWGLS